MRKIRVALRCVALRCAAWMPNRPVHDDGRAAGVEFTPVKNRFGDPGRCSLRRCPGRPGTYVVHFIGREKRIDDGHSVLQSAMRLR